MNPATQINPTYTEFDRTMASGDETSLEITGDFVVCIEATDAFKIGFNNGPKTNFRKGFRFGMTVPITSVQLLNSSGLSNAITMGIGRGDIRDARLVLPSGGIETSEVPGSVFTVNSKSTLAANTGAWQFSSSVTRKCLCIKNLGGGRLWIKRNTNAVEEGHALDPGETLFLETTSDVTVRNNNAFSVDYSTWEILA